MLGSKISRGALVGHAEDCLFADPLSFGPLGTSGYIPSRLARAPEARLHVTA
jgi:hypothetical protein